MKAKTAIALNRIYLSMGLFGNVGAAAFFGYFYKQADPELLTKIKEGMEQTQVLVGLPFEALAVYCGVMALLHLVLILSPKKPFWWWINFFNLVWGVGSSGCCCCLSLFALIGWVQEPLRKEYFKKRRKRGKS